jgi:hypothetical protein
MAIRSEIPTKNIHSIMAIWCNCFMSALTSFLGILSYSNSLIDGNANSNSDEGLTCHHVVLNFCTSGLYLAALSLSAVLGNLLWQ